MAGRPCKYGEKVNGKCPPKPKSQVVQAKTTRKQRPCKYGERVDGKCPPKPKSQVVVQAKTTRKQRPCKYGARVNGKCPPKPKLNKSVKSPEKYAHHVKCTIEFYFSIHTDKQPYFRSEKQLSDWFKSGDSYSYIYPEEDDDEVFNFKYRAEIIKNIPKYYIHVEFDTNKDPEYIMYNILGSMENNDPDGNYPVMGELVYGEIVDDSIYISNSEEYS